MDKNVMNKSRLLYYSLYLLYLHEKTLKMDGSHPQTGRKFFFAENSAVEIPCFRQAV